MIHKNWLPTIIIICSMVLASYWVFLVPIFQSPDEDYHADYVFSLYSRKRLILGREAPLSACSHPYISYLFNATNGQRVKWTKFVRVPSDYGTKEFFQKIDKNEPSNEVCAHVDTNPFVVAYYPIGYYGLVAVWLELLSQFNHHVSFLFFAARFFSVILLGSGLALSYLIMRELRISRGNATLVLAAIAFFPLMSFVGSYIQADNLGFTATSACLFLALRWRNRIIRGSHNFSVKKDYGLWALALTMAILLLTKYQYFFCAALSVIAMMGATLIRFRIPLGKIIAIFALIAIPSLFAGILQIWVSWRSSLPTIDATHWHWFPTNTQFESVLRLGPNALITHIFYAIKDITNSFYNVDGDSFKTFWGCFGQCTSIPMIIGSVRVNDILLRIIWLLTIAVILLTLISFLKLTVIMLVVLKKKRWRTAVYLVCSNPVINCYFVFVVFTFWFNVTSYPSFFWQGRYWYPVILPLVLAASCFAPRFFPSKSIRKYFFYAIIIAWLIYSVLGSYYAIKSVHRRYYEPDNQPFIQLQELKPISLKTPFFIKDFNFVDENTTFRRHVNPLIMPLGDDMIVKGWATDILNRAPATAVLLFVDKNKIYRAACGFKCLEAEAALHDKSYRYSGFEALIPTQDIGPGTHHLSMKIVSKKGSYVYSTDTNISFPISNNVSR